MIVDAPYWNLFLTISFLQQVVKTENVFYMLSGKRWNATAVETHRGISREHCIGMCFLNNNYRALNVYQNNGVHVCELFDINQCELTRN